MNFVSLAFFIFIPLVLLVYYLLPKRFRYLELLIVSYGFYMYYNVFLVFLLFFVTLITYLFAYGISKDEKHKKTYLVWTLIITLGLLLVFKYLDFAYSGILSIASLFGIKTDFISFNIILPMGISFFTFQTLSYVIDVYNGKFKCETNYLYYSLFVIYFPQLVAGPIERPGDLLPQLRDIKQVSFENISKGLKFIFSGYLKKILVADMLAIYVDKVYSDISSYSGFVLIFATFLFGIQIYCDFSGYSEIAIGISSLLGIKLTENFNKPYLSINIKEFWRRWHITLTRWFTDYVYIPLGGNRKGKVRTYINILIVFLLSGLWHGANLTFVIWGLIHGVALVIFNIFDSLTKFNKENIFYKIISYIVTMLVVFFAWIFFRSQSVAEAFLIISKIFTAFDITNITSLITSYKDIVIIVISLIVLGFSGFLPRLERTTLKLNEDDKNIKCMLVYFVLFLLLIVVRLYFVNIGGESSFIYFEF